MGTKGQDWGALVNPFELFSREEVLAKKCPVPAKSGVYGWYFADIPPHVPVDNCIKYKKRFLLYVGISPGRPPRNTDRPSRQNLRKRIRYHYRGNARGSTLRLTLGCLLSEILDIKLRRIRSDTNLHFTKAGEEKLSSWMSDNAFVVWMQHSTPWDIEEKIIQTISLPLNLQGNRHHPFHSHLSEIRRQAKQTARNSPIVDR
jgi:hypothetical protein